VQTLDRDGVGAREWAGVVPEDERPGARELDGRARDRSGSQLPDAAREVLTEPLAVRAAEVRGELQAPRRLGDPDPEDVTQGGRELQTVHLSRDTDVPVRRGAAERNGRAVEGIRQALDRDRVGTRSGAGVVLDDDFVRAVGVERAEDLDDGRRTAARIAAAVRVQDLLLSAEASRGLDNAHADTVAGRARERVAVGLARGGDVAREGRTAEVDRRA